MVNGYTNDSMCEIQDERVGGFPYAESGDGARRDPHRADAKPE